MRTPFDKQGDVKREGASAEWAAHSEGPKRSVFGNYTSADGECSGRTIQDEGDTATQDSLAPQRSAGRGTGRGVADQIFGPFVRASSPQPSPPLRGGEGVLSLQATIDSAVARSFLYQFLARAFDDPTVEVWEWLTSAGTCIAFESAVQAVASAAPPLSDSASTLAARLRTEGFEPFQIAYVVAFGHAARGDCPLNEIEYGDLNADPLFQPHRLADLAAFYRAFGLEVADGATERPDHIGLELEFMSVLAAREAYALEQQFDNDLLVVCRDAQKKFLREHLGRWSPAFARRLARNATDETLGALAKFLADFIGAECTRFGVRSGSEDLLLRPVDEAAETLCGSCGLHNLPPGAGASGATT